MGRRVAPREARRDPRSRVRRAGAGEPPLRLARRRGSRHADRPERRLHVRLLEARHPLRRGGCGRGADPVQRAREAGRRVPPGAHHRDRPGRPPRDDRRRLVRRRHPRRRARRRVRHRRDAGLRGGRARVLLDRRRRADARRAARVHGRDDPDRRPRPAVQVPARAVRGRVPAPRPARRARDPGADRDPGRRSDVRAGSRHAAGLAALPRRARRARDRVHGAEPRRRARPVRQGGRARERRAAALRPVRRDPDPPRAGGGRGVGPRRERLGRRGSRTT